MITQNMLIALPLINLQMKSKHRLVQQSEKFIHIKCLKKIFSLFHPRERTTGHNFSLDTDNEASTLFSLSFVECI